MELTRARTTALIAVGALTIATACGGDDDTADAPATDAPTDTAPPDTAPPDTAPPDTAPPDTGPPATDAPTDTAPPDTGEPDGTRSDEDALAAVEPCTGDETGDDGAIRVVEAAIAGRQLSDPSYTAACLAEVPEAFDDQPPACWSACEGAERIVADLDLEATQMTHPNQDPETWWAVSLPVSYLTTDGALLDVTESWQIDDLGSVREVRVGEPPFDRTGAHAVIVDYLAAVERADWQTVAELLEDGGLGIAPERDDLAELQLTEYTVDEVAAELERWCATGCATDVPELDDLVFTGTFELRRDDRTIRTTWFEGVYSINGLPFPRT